MFSVPIGRRVKPARTALLVLALVVCGAQPAHAAGPAAPQRAALAQLQSRIDATLARTSGGTQTAIDEISWDNGAVVLTFPMPAGAESLASDRARAAAGTSYNWGCPYGTIDKWFCLYENRGFNGLKRSDEVAGNGRRLRFKDGGYQALHRYDFQNKPSSWVNNNGATWEVYDWYSGDPNCGEHDHYAVPGNGYFEATGGSGSNPGRSAYVGDGNNDKVDCIHKF